MAKNRFEIAIQATAKGFQQVKQQLSGQLQGGLDASAAAVSRLNARLSQLEADYTATQQSLKKVSAFKKLKTDTAALGKEWQQAQARIAELSREIKTTDGPTAQLKRSFNAQVKAAQKLKAQYRKNEVGLEEMRREMSAAGVDTKNLGGAQKQLEHRLNSIQGEIKQTSAAFKAAQKPTATFFTRAKTGVNAFHSRLEANTRSANAWAGKLRGAFASVAGAAGLGYLINRQIDMADATAKTADKIGVSTDALQEYRYAADRAGVNNRALEMGLQRFTRRMAEAAQGQGELKSTLDKYGISVRDANGNMRASEDVLGDLADAVQGAESESEQLRIAFKAFDSEGAALVNMLKEGKDGLDDYRESARRLGIVVEEDILRQSEDAADSITDLKSVISSQLMRAIASLAPEIARISRDFTQWIISQKNLNESLKSIVSTSWEWAKAIGEFIRKYGKFIAGLVATKIAIGYLRALGVAVAAVNSGFTAMTGIGVVTWLKGYIAQANIAVTQNGALAASFATLRAQIGLAAGALGAFFAGWQIGKVIGEIDVVERAVQGMYATIDEWITKAKIKYLELARVWRDLWGDDDAVAGIDRQIEAQKRHLEVIDLTREKIKQIDDSRNRSAEKAIESSQKRMRAAMDEARAEVEAEAQKRAANQETEEQEKEIYKAKKARIDSRADELKLALDEEIAAIDLAEARKQITEDQARQKRIEAQRDFLRQRLEMTRAMLQASVESEAEETEKKIRFEQEMKTEIRRLEIDLTRLKARELSQQTTDVRQADEEQEKSAKEKYRERISLIREETSAQRDELQKQLDYIDDLESEGVISHQEAVDRKIRAEMDFARAKVEAAKKTAAAAREIHGEESAEYQIAVNKMAQAAKNLADKKVESEKRAVEAQKALQKDLGAWLMDYTRQTVAESARTYSEFMKIIRAQMDNVNQFIYGESMKQESELAGAVQKVKAAFEGTAKAVKDAYGVSIDYSEMTFSELQDAVREVQDLFRGLRDDMQASYTDVEAISQGIDDWGKNISDVDAGLRDFSEQSRNFQAAWGELWSDSPKSVGETKEAIDRVKSAYAELVADGEAAISALKSQWDGLESKIQSVEEQIQSLYGQTTDTIRELNRELMTDEQAWLDERQQAHELFNQAVSEMNRGNYEAANKLFDEARGLAKGLAREVQDESGAVVRSLDDTTSAAVAMIREITQAQGGNLEQLKGTLESQQADIRSQIDRTQAALEGTAGKIGRINEQLRLSAKEIRDIMNSLPSDWFGAGSPRHSFAAGGRVAGPSHAGGGVDINAEGGEYIEPKNVVKKYGSMVFEAFRQFKIDKSAVDWLLSGGRQVMGDGGLVRQSIARAAPAITAPRLQPKMVFAEGGQVPSVTKTRVEKLHRIRFDFGRGKTIDGDFSADGAQALVRALESAKLRSN